MNYFGQTGDWQFMKHILLDIKITPVLQILTRAQEAVLTYNIETKGKVGQSKR